MQASPSVRPSVRLSVCSLARKRTSFSGQTSATVTLKGVLGQARKLAPNASHPSLEIGRQERLRFNFSPAASLARATGKQIALAKVATQARSSIDFCHENSRKFGRTSERKKERKKAASCILPFRSRKRAGNFAAEFELGLRVACFACFSPKFALWMAQHASWARAKSSRLELG